jgi:hypothetical protein
MLHDWPSYYRRGSRTALGMSYDATSMTLSLLCRKAGHGAEKRDERTPDQTFPTSSCCNLSSRLKRLRENSRIWEARRAHRRSLRSATPDFLLTLVALVRFLRPSLRKGAHAALSSAAWQELRVRYGRDDNSSWKLYLAFPNKIVIPTGPGFPATHRWTKPCVLLSLRKAAWSTPTPPSPIGNPG